MNHYYDCTGNILNAWNGIGLAKDHSNDVADCVSFSNSFNDVKYAGIAQGLLFTIGPLAYISYIMYSLFKCIFLYNYI